MKIEVRDNIYVQLDKGNLRGFTLFTNSENVVLRRGKEYEINTIIVEDRYKIKVGDELTIDGVNYVVNKIRQGTDYYYYCVQERATKTSQFIMPILGYSYEYFDFKESFYNSYLSENYHSIFLVYKFINSEEYLQLEERLQKHSNFVRIIDPNPNIVVFEFTLDEKYWKDIDLIMRGKYSNISTTLKSKICIFHKFGVQSKTYKVLYRDKKLREDMSEEYGFEITEEYELMSKPIISEELWRNSEAILARTGMKCLNTM